MGRVTTPSHCAFQFHHRMKGVEGATAVEYSLMIALIALVIVGAVFVLGTNLNSLFTEAANTIP